MSINARGKIIIPNNSRIRVFPNAISWLVNGAPYESIVISGANTTVSASKSVVNKISVEGVITSANIIIEGSTFPVNFTTTPTTAMTFAPNTAFENQLSAAGQIYNFTVNGVEYQIVFES